MFEEQGNEGYENIVKAQALFRRLMECEPGGEFKKIFADAIQQHTLDEFYPVVVRAELSAALMLCHSPPRRCRVSCSEITSTNAVVCAPRS